jgi:hypothetical protein
MIKSMQSGGRAMPRVAARVASSHAREGFESSLRSGNLSLLVTFAIFVVGIASCTYLFMRNHEIPAYVILAATVGAAMGSMLSLRLGVNSRSPVQAKQSAEANLARLYAYRQRDPFFHRAIERFADAEVSIDDPLEGEAFEENAEPMGPAQTRIRELLGA